jgi:hypothetical protein
MLVAETNHAAVRKETHGIEYDQLLHADCMLHGGWDKPAVRKETYGIELNPTSACRLYAGG